MPVALITASLLVAACLMPVMMALARRFNVIDQPRDRKIHKQPVPYLGGIGIMAGIVAAAAVLLFLNPGISKLEHLKAASIVCTSVLACLVGLLDDSSKIRARHKLAGQIAIALAFSIAGFHFHALTIPGLGLVSLQYLEIPLTTLWIVTIVNAFNLVDGADGLAGSVAMVVLAVTGLMAVYLHDWVIGALALAGIGAVIGFLIFNWRPAKIYMGDAGSHGLGMLIATSLVALGQNEAYLKLLQKTPGSEPFLYHIPLATAAAAYPVLEISLTVLRRLLNGKPIGSADKGHIHHRLMSQGWSAPQTCYSAIFLSLIVGGAVIYTLMQYRGAAAWFLGVSGLTLGLCLHFCGFLDMLRPSSVRGNRPYFLIANHFINMQKLKLDLVQNIGELHALIAQTCSEFGIQSLSLTLPAVDNQSEPAEFLWQRPEDLQRAPLLPQRSELPPLDAAGDLTPFSDRAGTSSGARAEWTFEAGTEDDIDIEYRVLMSDFMSKVLDRAARLYATLDRTQLKAALRGDRPVSSTELRRRSSRHEAPSIGPEPSA